MNEILNKIKPEYRELLAHLLIIIILFVLILIRSKEFEWHWHSFLLHSVYYSSIFYLISIVVLFYLLTIQPPLMYLNQEFNNGNYKKAITIILFLVVAFIEITGLTDLYEGAYTVFKQIK